MNTTRTSPLATAIFVAVLAVLGALALLHYLTPCEAGALCSALLPAGCDQQGRHDTRPFGPAEAATEIGADDDHLPGDGSLAWLGMSLLLGSALAAILGVLYALS